VTSLFDSSGGSGADVFFEQPLGGSICFGGSSATLPGSKGLSFRGELGVTLDRGEADAEQASGLGFRCPTLLYGLNYFLAQVFRISFHVSMIDHRPGLQRCS
jgi:hypothetical protein